MPLAYLLGRRRLVALGALFVLSACSDEAGTEPAIPTTTPAGTGGAAPPACPPGEQPLPSGECLPAGAYAGVPTERCADGFVPDAEGGGCEAVLPVEPCPAGELALPGETACHPLGSCGDGTWGSIPVDGATVFVDASYAQGDGDGSQARPFPTIGEAMAAAASGATIALAAGSYAEDVRIEGQTVHLHGRCASRVRITGTGFEAATVSVVDATGVELRGFSVDGPRAGIWLRDAPESTVEQIYLASPGHVGLVVRGAESSPAVRELLVESAVGSGILIFGAAAQIEGAVVRDTACASDGSQGFGITVQPDATHGTRGRLELTGSVIERSRSAGVALLGADAILEGIVIRDTLPEEGTGTGGQGIQVVFDPATGERGDLRIAGSVVERSRTLGLLVSGADAEVDDTVIRDTGWQAPEPGRFWAAAWLEHDASGERAFGALRSSLLERSSDAALLASGAELEVESTWVRDTRAGPRGWGRGMELAGSPLGPGRTSVDVIGSRVERSRGLGVFVAGAAVRIDATLVRDTLASTDGSSGYGVLVQDQTHTGERGLGTVRFCAVEANLNCGILASSADVTIESTVVRSTLLGVEGGAGFGVEAQRSTYDDGSAADGAVLVLRDSLVEDNVALAVAVFGSQAEIADSELQRTSADAFGLLGDGLALVPHHGFRAGVTLRQTRVAEMARAGIANFGGDLRVERARLECNPIPINGEPWHGEIPQFEDLGGNSCLCGDAVEDCAVRSTGLEAPEPVR